MKLIEAIIAESNSLQNSDVIIKLSILYDLFLRIWRIYSAFQIKSELSWKLSVSIQPNRFLQIKTCLCKVSQ